MQDTLKRGSEAIKTFPVLIVPVADNINDISVVLNDSSFKKMQKVH